MVDKRTCRVVHFPVVLPVKVSPEILEIVESWCDVKGEIFNSRAVFVRSAILHFHKHLKEVYE